MKSNEEFWQRYYNQSKVNDSDKFGRMFPFLPSAHKDTKKVRSALLELGKKEGIMDNDSKNLDNPKIPSGFTFFGQFIDHDITFDPTSSLEHQNDPNTIENFRTPVLELDSIYGGGPVASPHLYDITTGGIKLLIDKDFPNDVPRNSQNTALMADPRNDENLIISQLHLSFLKFHNAVVDQVIANGITAPFQAFAEAQRLVRWHYQWIVLYEYLPLIVGKSVIKDILKNGRKFYKFKNKPYIPVEFAMAAFRIGHSQVRPVYKVNSQFTAPIFNSSQDQNHPDPDDLRGGKRAPRRFVEWSNFFNTESGVVQQGKKIDTTISSPMFELPFVPDPKALPQRSLLRGLSFGLPSGQDIAKEMFIRPLLPVDLSDVADLGFDRKTPLWFYILREAQIEKDGTRLGPVGGRIVAEVLIGLLQGDEQSFLRENPDWKPTLGKKGKFRMTDLLKIAGVL
ncbi:peroxidase family protein [Lysinibacillus endophyticus]|uniref:peroxidase family protein n=1 Tax=Ureibacillus endophyticus TaxID=1978490 RepID=UPI00209EB638|nr:heme peroxidase family protein [Lysinibacillus endophyticus]MCP1146087.1 heme peroxidase family protein [Lysinibacillus endophyticus]